MLSLDLFDSRFEKRLQEGAVDNLEARRIDDLNMRMLDLLDRAKEPAYKKNPAALAGLKKQFQTIKAERDSYFKINPATGMDPTGSLGTVKGALDELGIPGNVPVEKIPGKEDLLKGKGRSYYEDQKKSSDEVAQDQRLHVGDPVVVTAPNEFEGKTGEISEFSPSGKFVVVNLYNHGEHSMHLSDVEYNKYADEEVDEGWSDRALAQRTGQPRTPYSVYIKGRKWKDFENEDHARAVMDKLKAKFKAPDSGLDPEAITIAPTDMSEAISKKGVAETVTDVRSLWAKAYHKLAPRIERHRDSFLAGQLYDELENIAELHGAEREFKQMMSTARGRAHMEYDTNPGGFQNWFWFLPFEDEGVEESKQKGVDGKACWKGYKRMGTKQKGGKTVDNCVKMGEDRVSEDYSDSSDAVERAILNRIMVAHTDLLKQFGPQKVMQAAEEVAYDVGDVDEIGTSDVSAYVNQVKQILGAV
jgi:hypothetical protein